MTRRRILFAIMAFIAITIAIVILQWPSWKSKLNIALRCQVEESFDVETACEEGSLEFNHYTGWSDVFFTFKRDNGEVTELTSKYGPDIQVEDHHGFFVVIRILNAPPFLANDSI